MTNWRAVLIGFVAHLVFGLVAMLLPGIGHLAAGLLGGFVAGYIAGGSLGSGAWHGLLAGSLGGIIIAGMVAFVVTVLGTVGLGPLGPFLGGATFFGAIALALFFAIDSAIGGLLGAAVSDN